MFALSFFLLGSFYFVFIFGIFSLFLRGLLITRNLDENDSEIIDKGTESFFIHVMYGNRTKAFLVKLVFP